MEQVFEFTDGYLAKFSSRTEVGILHPIHEGNARGPNRRIGCAHFPKLGLMAAA